MRSILLLAIALLLLGVANAAEKTDACAEEAAKFCPDVAPGTALQQCLQEHADDLSKRCRRRLARVAAGGSGQCAEDRAKLCGNVANDRRALAKCMRANEEKLSEGCQAARQQRKACRDDIAKFCADTEKGGGRIKQCLRSHAAELSADCKTALASRS